MSLQRSPKNRADGWPEMFQVEVVSPIEDE